jgi:gas vesicle protein
MASAPAKTADEISSTMKHLLERVREGEVADQVAQTGRDVASILADATATAAARAEHAWKDSAPLRRDAAKTVRGASHDAASWSSRTWKRRLRPAIEELWGQRTVAVGAAGAAIPASRELVDNTAVRLGLKRREERHWGAFFAGLLIGAAIGAVVAMLSAPKPGRQMRRELVDRARDAGEWTPLFQRTETDNHADAEPPQTSKRGDRETKAQIEDAAAGETSADDLSQA